MNKNRDTGEKHILLCVLEISRDYKLDKVNNRALTYALRRRHI